MPNTKFLISFSAYWNIAIAALLVCPTLYQSLGLNLQQPMWGWLIAGFLLYTSATLIISARDLSRYGAIVVYEGILRFIAAILVIPAGLWFDYGYITVALGLGDAMWGYIYLSKVPLSTGRSLKQLFLDQD